MDVNDIIITNSVLLDYN